MNLNEQLQQAYETGRRQALNERPGSGPISPMYSTPDGVPHVIMPVTHPSWGNPTYNVTDEFGDTWVWRYDPIKGTWVIVTIIPADRDKKKYTY